MTLSMWRVPKDQYGKMVFTAWLGQLLGSWNPRSLHPSAGFYSGKAMHKLLEAVDWGVRVDPTGEVVGWRQSWTLLLLYYSPSWSNPELWVGWPSTIAERNALGVPGPIFLSPIGGPQSEARWKATWLQHSLAYLTRTYTNGFFFLRIKLPILLVYPDLCHWQVHYDEVLVHTCALLFGSLVLPCKESH